MTREIQDLLVVAQLARDTVGIAARHLSDLTAMLRERIDEEDQLDRREDERGE